jgi:alpha-ketoglutarate-dependent 2,4-dichlorophenoxyacetate dioxygenase
MLRDALKIAPANVAFHRQHPLFFARTEGVDLANMDDATFAAVEAAFDQYAVLHFPQQSLTQEQHVAFSRRLGSLEVVTMGASIDGGRSTLPEINRVSNLGLDNRIRPINDLRRMYSQGNQLWHTDSTYKHVPSKCSLLYALQVPPKGGNTEFADMRAAYDDLSADLKGRIDDLVVEHSVFTSRAKIGFSDFSAEARASHPPAHQVLVRRHPVSGRKSLYLASHASHIVGWPEDEGRALLADLIAHASQAKYIHSHRWTVGDLVMWDNRYTMHRATPFDSMDMPRDMHRTTVQDIGNTVELSRR